MRIESIRLKNFRVFNDATLSNIPGFCVLVGANGSGKSTLFDVFNFLQHCLQHNVSKALNRRGGFKEVVSRGATGPIEIEIKFRASDKRLATYFLQISEEKGRGVVEREILKLRRGQHGSPWHFLDFSRGKGEAVVNEAEDTPYELLKREPQSLAASDILAIKGLGQFPKFKTANEFSGLLEGWHVSDFHIQSARSSSEDGVSEHLSRNGDNLDQVAQYLAEFHPDIFSTIKEKMAQRVPGVEKMDVRPTEDGRLLLRFQDGAFKDPFIAKYVSDGTLRMFAYLVLLHDPTPFPLLAVEEPENQLYPDLMAELAEEFREYAERGGQVFVSTHSPDFLNYVDLSEIFWLAKKEGFSDIRHAGEDPLLRQLVEEGETPGRLWKQGRLRGAGPR
jgi:predicted ATPase